MAASTVIILVLSCAFTYGTSSPPTARNTIFMDEKLEGQIFEVIDFYSDDVENFASYRLPTTTRPIHYNLLWAVDIQRLTFSGDVEINLHATQQNVNEIVIHAHDLDITSVQLIQNTTTIPQNFTLDPKLQFMKIKLQNNFLQYDSLNPVVYKLKISFAALLRTDMSGIYKSWFRNPSENEQWMATTQFQATAARFAFPCYDEPSFKATFKITIRRPNNLKSWSLTSQINTVNASQSGYSDDIYRETPVMSTYLLALIVADYDSISIPENVNEPLRYEVIARSSVLRSQGNYALNLGRNLTERMGIHTGKDFFDIHENLKMTHAAIPDFAAGAMENFGLITYREAYILYDEEHTNDYYKQLIAYVLSHEIAHMWFGNWVTCDFWDNTWLNEGFARYYQYFLTDWVEDYMGLASRFINEQVHTVLLSDSSDSAHPLTNPNIGSPSSISAMFSSITYNKGACVIRMTEHLLGSAVHEAGLRKYLQDNAFKTARPIDLFEALQNVSVGSGAISQYRNFSVIEYYKSWTEQAGHPIVQVQVNHTNGDMFITQRRFNINSGVSSDHKQYIIPITFTSADKIDFEDLKPSHIFSEGAAVINRGSVGDHWVIFNKQQSGFYRVNYDNYTWDLIVRALRSDDRTKIHEYNRAQIVNDVFQFSRSGLMSYTRAFNILSFLEHETEYTPWVAAITGFNWIRNRLANTPLKVPFENRIIKWSSKAINQLSYYPKQNDTFMTSYLRYQLAPFLCSMGAPECLAAAEQQFRALAVNGTEVPVNSRNWVYCHALRKGSKADFDVLWNRFNNHNVYTEKILLLQTLGCTNDEESLNTLLTNIIEDTFVIRQQDYNAAFSAIFSGNEENTNVVFRFIQKNTTQVLNAFGSASPLTTVASRLRSNAEIDLFLQWAATNNETLGNYYNSIVQSAESTRQSFLWTSQVQDDIDQYLQQGDTAISTSTSAPVTSTPSPTVTAPPLVNPDSPTIPGSATNSFVSVFVLLTAILVNIIA